MKKLIFIIVILLTASISTFWLYSIDKKKVDNKTEKKVSMSGKENKKSILVNQTDNTVKLMPEGHSKKSFDCKSCHICEYPTKRNPCLANCPRTQISIYHSPDEGPDVIALKKLSDRYGKVVFSHKIHAQMSEMAGGCTSCHHYNTTGPVLNCKNCHLPRKERVDITIPDLEAAYHRQCMNCHRQWNVSTNCYSCHIPKENHDKELNKLVKKVKKAVHPELPRPLKTVYETNYKKGKIVTFYHDEHAILFGISCKSCHHDENCARCHDTQHSDNKAGLTEQHKKVHKTFEQHHKPCASCHNTKKCDKCHKEKEMDPFNHGISTGWDFGKLHTSTECSKCHKENKFTKMDRECKSCHKNFTPEKFDHKVTGLSLDANHAELDCESCHELNHFKVIKTKCLDCHDESLNPNLVPGKKVTPVKKRK